MVLRSNMISSEPILFSPATVSFFPFGSPREGIFTEPILFSSFVSTNHPAGTFIFMAPILFST